MERERERRIVDKMEEKKGRTRWKKEREKWSGGTELSAGRVAGFVNRLAP
jgi:hypothetical protein